MALGIRRLVDRDPRTDSLWTVIDHVRKHPEFLTRELFLCYDGLPFDYAKAQRDYYAGQDLSNVKGGVFVSRLSTRGPTGWAMAEVMDKAFDRIADNPGGRRKRLDCINPDLLDRLTDELQHPSIETVRTMADKRYAHAERFPTADAIPTATYNDIDDALRRIVRVANFLSSHFFYDATFGSVVATPQFDVLESLDHPWVTPDALPALHRHWYEVCAAMDRWAYDTAEGFLPPQKAG